ncbi:cation:proton antiporter [Sporolactobacillus terrae]|uniref:Sodium:proton antiporter n=1 Tax=Sporolactobacillus terrae TaxID=269673 RepID=A0A5K7WSM0_9BACL|nr:cation:proton antiporter [Sporolactobacillus terrae]BBN97671.1 sodium:proton antiporter [Sporolactobacillus terrae]
MQLLLQLTIIILATKIAGHLSVYLKQPAVLGELIVGIIIGPALLGWIPNSDLIHQLSEIGVILLMFIAGLETDLASLRSNAKSSSAVAVGGILFPLGFGFIAGMALGMNMAHAIFLGLILSATSVSITVQTLKEMKQLHTRESITILGAAVLDDVLVIVLLAFVMSFIGGGDQNVFLVIGEKVLFFATILLISWKGVPLAMRVLGKLNVSEPLISAALVLCFIYAYYAELLGVAGIIGAFIAGATIGQTKFRKIIEQKAEPIAYGVFVPIFFVSIGLNVSFSGIGQQMIFIVVLSLLAIGTKLVGAGTGAYLTGFDLHGSIKVGAGMISRGEVALILAKLGLDAHLLAERYFTPLILVVMVTTLVTPPLLKILFNKGKIKVGAA